MLIEPIEIYRKLRVKKTTVSLRQQGVVVGHVDTSHRAFFLKDVDLVVQPAGRQKVAETGMKSVHAWIKGTLCNPTKTEQQRLACSTKPVKYDPRQHAFFTNWNTDKMLDKHYDLAFVMAAENVVMINVD